MKLQNTRRVRYEESADIVVGGKIADDSGAKFAQLNGNLKNM